MDDDRRRDYRSILPGTEVIYRAAPVRPQDRRYLLGVAENLSLGGLFISTRQPFAVGTVVMLDLFPGTGDDRSPFSASAVVRWRQLWREPRGMGLQFLDFTNLAERPMQALLDNALAPPPAWRLPAGADPSLS
ncbi:MAG: PilZ domain-containing protein [Acidobacteria bacterium]|nr:PilZ domain-containing protein [Acidobacteriota bacterium]